MKGTKLEEQVQNFNENMQISKRNVFSVLQNNLKHLISYFAKQSKLGETVTCFVQFRISRN